MTSKITQKPDSYPSSYLMHFQVALSNLDRTVQEERLQKKLRKSRTKNQDLPLIQAIQ